MISAFGAAARAFALEIDALPAVISDVASLPQAYLEAVRRRERAERFYAMIVRDDEELANIYQIAANIARVSTDQDLRDLQLRVLAQGKLVIDGRQPAEYFKPNEQIRVLAFEFYGLADAILVRSYQEYQWAFGLFEERPAPPMERVLARRRVPEAERTAPQRPGVVVWAPGRSAEMLALHAAALQELRGDVTFVAAGGALPASLGAAVVGPQDPRVAQALATATCVVCAEPNDPADAVAFAERGYGVVATLASGAHEFLHDVGTWDGRNGYVLYANVLAAIGRSSSVRARPDPPRPLAAAPPPPAAELPLVSIIVPTFNRRSFLTAVLGALAAQTYPRLEVVVVNDAGVAVDDIVARHPFAKLVVHEMNRGSQVALRTGFEASTGDYVGFLPDDDWVYPDHVWRIMEALLHAGATFAHGCSLLRFLRTAPDGGDRLRGFNVRTFSKTMNMLDVLSASTVSVNQCLQHRRVFEEVGWFLEDSAVSDNEFHLRLLERYTPAYVPFVTGEFRDHERGSQGKSLDLRAALEDMYTRLHPYPNRPYLSEVRKQTLSIVGGRTPGASPFPPILEFSDPPGG